MNTAVNSSPSQAKNKKLTRTFTVGAIGLTGKDLNSLSRIFSITSFRPRSYRLLNIDLNTIENINEIDIFVVNICNIENTLRWQNLAKSHYYLAAKKPIKVFGPSQPSSPGGYTIETPFNPIRALKTFDTYTVRELNYLPEVEIGNESVAHERSSAEFCKLRTVPQPARSQYRALIADDSLAVRRQLEIEFNLLGAETFIAANGEEALSAIDKNRFDIIFLDVVMPGIDGYTACKKIKKSELNHYTPVIMLTSRSSSFDKIKGALAGCDTYLTKPISQHEFASIAHQYLK